MSPPPLSSLFVVLVTLTAASAVPARRVWAQAPVPQDEALSPAELFERGRIAFGRGEYARAVQTLRPLLYPEIRLRSEGEVVQAHRMLGVAHLFENQQEPAREEFGRLLELRPDYRFDPLLDPPVVVEFFNKVLREREAEISALQAQRRRAEREADERRRRLLEMETPRVVEKRYARNSYLLNFVPFGAGQFQNGQRGKGWLFLGSELALAAASVGTFTTNFALFGFRPRRPCSTTPALSEPCPVDEVDRHDENLSANLKNISLVTGGLFYAVAAWGIVDALMHYEPLTPIEEGPGPGAPPRGPRVSLFPAILGSVSGPSLGPGLGLRF